MSHLYASHHFSKTHFFGPLFLFAFLILAASLSVEAQPSIAWQESIGTTASDEGLSLFRDESENLVVIGREPHADFTGNVRPYMFIAKFDPDGNELWKQYHDVAFETFNPPLDYYLGGHFVTEEFGDTLINLVININNRTILYKMLNRDGSFYYYEEITSPIIDVARDNDRVYAGVLCSIQQSCYGPDSLVIEKFDPTPDSMIFNPIEWTFELKQNIRTASITGHYDFNLQDIRLDHEGNVYLLVQIERWDFQFCTDCADAFVDAWCEVFKLNPDGEWVGHKRLKVSHAVVSHMGFVSFADDEMVIRIDDINGAGTAIVTSIFKVNPDLLITKQFTLDRNYPAIVVNQDDHFIAAANIFDPLDTEIKGLTDVLISEFDANGTLQWKKYLGGSGYDFIRGLTLTADDDFVFMAHTDSDDFDVTDAIGDQDIWLVKLGEGTSGVFNPTQTTDLVTFPNPATDHLFLQVTSPTQVEIYDVQGRQLLRTRIDNSRQRIDVCALPAGVYGLLATDPSGRRYVGKWIKM